MKANEKIYYLDGKTLNIRDLHHIAANNISIDLTQEAWEKVSKSRNAVKAMMSDPKKVVYGINTGFGNFADKIITADQRAQLQVNLIRSHAVGVGNPLPVSIVKKMIILRINTLSKGRSGIDPENLKRYIDAYNKDFTPLIPEKGTVGASGDLAPLSHLALGMMGQGKAWDEETKQYIATSEVMAKKNLTPVYLTQKQGLALINGTQFMSSIISEVEYKTQKVLESAIIVFLFAAEVFGLETDIFFSPESISFYSSKDKKVGEIMEKMKNYLDEEPSELSLDRRTNAQKNNRCSSILQAIENLSAVVQAIEFCRKIVNQQINSATDNPLVYLKQDGFENDELISAGNFHGEYVAKSADFISMALFSLGRFSEARVQRYINERISNLPGFLACNGGLNSGFMIVQYTSAALLSECKVLAKPASADSISTSASQEDHVSMGGFAARKSREMLENISYIIGIELLHALQAIDMVGKPSTKKLQAIKKQVRKSVPYFKEDDFFGDAMQQCKVLVQNGIHLLGTN